MRVGVLAHGTMPTVAFVAFDGLTALDLVGVYTALTRLDGTGAMTLEWEVVAPSTPVRSATGLVVEPDTVDEPIAADIVVVPGGPATRELVDDDAFIDWLADGAATDWMVSVCTGSLLLGAAGMLEDRAATTHPDAFDLLEPYCGTVREDRVVVDGSIVTARGVTASIDVGLWLCRELGGSSAVRTVRNRLDYPFGPI